MNETVPLRRSDVRAGSGNARDTVCVLTSQGCVTTPLTVPMGPMSLHSAIRRAVQTTMQDALMDVSKAHLGLNVLVLLDSS